MHMLINRPCTLLLRVETEEKDRKGIPKVATTEVETVWECQPLGTVLTGDEGADQNEMTSTRRQAFFLADQDVESIDAVTDGIDGLTYEIDGAPTPIWDPILSGISHIEAMVKRAGGPGKATVS